MAVGPVETLASEMGMDVEPIGDYLQARRFDVKLTVRPKASFPRHGSSAKL